MSIQFADSTTLVRASENGEYVDLPVASAEQLVKAGIMYRCGDSECDDHYHLGADIFERISLYRVLDLLQIGDVVSTIKPQTAIDFEVLSAWQDATGS